MPGKHAPDSPRSFYLSLARAGGAAVGALALMTVAVVVLLSRGGGSDSGALPIVSGPTPTTSRSPSPTPSASKSTPARGALLPNRVPIDVRNATTRNGLARTLSKKINDEGYPVVAVGNQTSRLAKSTIFYRPGRRLEALAFQETFPAFTVLKESTSTGGAMLRVVIGADYP